MKGYVPQYEVRQPQSLREVLAIMNREPGVWKLIAGGTDLMVVLEAGKLEHRQFLSLVGARELAEIKIEQNHVRIGALVTHAQLQKHPALRESFPMLCQAAASVGAVAIQNRGTIGGNIANASPAADTPPTLLAYDAGVELMSETGSRWVPYREFHLGYKKLEMKPNEIISAVMLPLVNRPRKHLFRKVGTRKAQSISKVCFAGVAELHGDQIFEVRIALGSVAPTVIRCFKTEAVLRGKSLSQSLVDQATDMLSEEIAPIDDIRSTSEYRREVTLNIFREFAHRLAD